MISIDCTAVENEVADNMYQRAELYWLIYNVTLEYADLILNGDPEEYLKTEWERAHRSNFAGFSCNYFDTAQLSSVTFNYVSELELALSDNVLVLNTEGLELGKYDVVLNALYQNEVSKSVTLTIEISEDKTPILKENEIVIKQDKYHYDKEAYELDLSTNIINSASLLLMTIE